MRVTVDVRDVASRRLLLLIGDFLVAEGKSYLMERLRFPGGPKCLRQASVLAVKVGLFRL